jgi:hypothetical protein
VPTINTALQFWAEQRKKAVQYVFKGQSTTSQSLRSEMYSVFQYKVEDPVDKGTALNDEFISNLKIADKLLVCGQSLDHTVGHTVRGK